MIPAFTLTSRHLGHLSSGFLAALCCLPFLVPLHLLPLPSFHSEWAAAVLALALIGFSALRLGPRSIELPAITTTALLFLAIIGVQHVGKIGYFGQQSLLYVAYLILALALMVTGREVVAAIGMRRVATAMASGFAIGALLQCAVAFCQLQNWSVPGWIIPVRHGGGVYGNLAQQNHLTHYLWLGIISLVYLRLQRCTTLPAFVIATCAIAVASAYTASRSAILYPLAMVLAIGWASRYLADSESRQRLQRLGIFACIAALAALSLPELYPPAFTGLDETGLKRLLASTSAGVRWHLLETAARAVLAAPWLGHGVGSVPLQSLLQGPGDAKNAFGVAEHFHNIVANWAVEFGIVVTLVAVLLLCRWAVRVFKHSWSVEKIWALGILLIGALHSLLEYPLWYSFFLAPAAFLLGALDTKWHVVAISRLSKWAMGVGGVFSCFLLLTLWQDHTRLEPIYRGAPAGPQEKTIGKERLDTLLDIRQKSLFSPLTNLTLIGSAAINDEMLESKLQVCDAALQFSPVPDITFKCAALMLLSERTSEGIALATMGKRSFPRDATFVAKELEVLAVRYPGLLPMREMLARDSSGVIGTSDR